MLVSCEHGGNRVPPRYAALFRGAERVLASHRGHDLGSLELARSFARRLAAPLISATTTRLLVELNRSIGHPSLFSSYTRDLDDTDRDELLARYYYPYRRQVEAQIAATIAKRCVALHVSMHTFTPALDGHERRADIGLLYDPRRPLERQLCAAWREAIRAARGDLAVRRNYPYLGSADGLTTHLRRQHSAQDYVGVELEVNQRWAAASRADRTALQRTLAETFRTAQVACGLSAAAR